MSQHLVGILSADDLPARDPVRQSLEVHLSAPQVTMIDCQSGWIMSKRRPRVHKVKTRIHLLHEIGGV